METGKIIRYIGLNVAIVLLAAGCSQSASELPSQGHAIDFSPRITRSAVTSLGDGDSFAVWARESIDGTSRLILAEEEVHCSGNIWSYDNIRYWKSGATYDFYALYPHNTANVTLPNNVVGETPQITITEFDARNAVDLMTAEQTGFVYPGSSYSVVFDFRHLLSKVEIVGRIDPALEEAGVSARIISATLYGMAATGSNTVDAGGYGRWTLGPATTSRSPFSTRDTVDLSLTGVTLFGEMLPLPQTITQEFILEIEYEYTDAHYTQNRFSKTFRLADAGLTQWEPAKGYRYTFTVGSDYILFDKPEVVPWKSASGGIVTVE